MNGNLHVISLKRSSNPTESVPWTSGFWEFRFRREFFHPMFRVEDAGIKALLIG